MRTRTAHQLCPCSEPSSSTCAGLSIAFVSQILTDWSSELVTNLSSPGPKDTAVTSPLCALCHESRQSHVRCDCGGGQREGQVSSCMHMLKQVNGMSALLPGIENKARWIRTHFMDLACCGLSFPHTSRYPSFDPVSM